MFRRFLEKRKLTRGKKRSKDTHSPDEDCDDAANHVYEEIPDVINTAVQSQFRLITPNMIAPDGVGKDCSPYMVVPIVDRVQTVGVKTNDVNGSHTSSLGSPKTVTATVSGDKNSRNVPKNREESLNIVENNHNVRENKETRQNDNDMVYGFDEARIQNLNKLFSPKRQNGNVKQTPSVIDANLGNDLLDNEKIRKKCVPAGKLQSNMESSRAIKIRVFRDINSQKERQMSKMELCGEEDDSMEMDDVEYCANQNAYNTSLSSDTSMTSLQSSTSSNCSSASTSHSTCTSHRSLLRNEQATKSYADECKLSVRSTNASNHRMTRRAPQPKYNSVLSDLIRHNNDQRFLSLL